MDLNADIGESFGIYNAGNDERLLRSITSGSIACGFHAGDPAVMRHTVRLAARAGVSIGAHPGFPDLEGFGRREMNIEPAEIADLVLYQIGALERHREGRRRRASPREAARRALQHERAPRRDRRGHRARGCVVRRRAAAHGAAGIGAAFGRHRGWGFRVAAEAFADRSYEPDGTLTPRHMSRVRSLSEPGRAVERACAWCVTAKSSARDGSTFSLKVDTICVHGDTPALPSSPLPCGWARATGIEVRRCNGQSDSDCRLQIVD